MEIISANKRSLRKRPSPPELHTQESDESDAPISEVTMDVDVDYVPGKRTTRKRTRKKLVQPAMFQLNDDCLEHIFKMLQLHDQMQLARVCQRFRNVWLIVHKLDFKVIDMDRFGAWYHRSMLAFFEMAGPIIRKLIGNFSYTENQNDRRLEMITKFCPNINTICFDAEDRKLRGLFKWLPRMESVTALEFNGALIDDQLAEAIGNMRNLKILTFFRTRKFKGEHLDKLIHVKHLNLYGCSKMGRMNFLGMCKSMTELKSLNIQGCLEFSEATISKMVKHCNKLQVLKTSHISPCIAQLPSLNALELLLNRGGVSLQPILAALVEHTQQLEYLKIRSDNSYYYYSSDMKTNDNLQYNCAELIARLKKLKYFSSRGIQIFNDNFMYKYAELENLEEIHISGYKHSITDNGLMILLRNCTKLKHVNVTGCAKITDAFVVEATKLLDQRIAQPLVVHVANTGISQSLKHTKTTSKLKLSFVVPDTKVRSLAQLNCDHTWYNPLQQLNCNNLM